MVNSFRWLVLGLLMVVCALLVMRPTQAEASSCGVFVLDTVVAGDLALVVEGDGGVMVTVRDFDTDALLGSGVLSGGVCDASAEITLSSPTAPEQKLLIEGDDGSDWVEWVFPDQTPFISVVPNCADNGTVNAIVFGQFWQAADLDIYWEETLIGSTNTPDGQFAYQFELTGVANGVYEISVTDGTDTATILYELPCEDDGVIAGTVFADISGAWLPIDDVLVTASVADTNYTLSDVTLADGTYQFDIAYDELYELYACVEIDGEAYETAEFDVPLGSPDVDLYLEPSGFAKCIDSAPVEPTDLTIGTPQVVTIDSTTWQVTVAITNTNNVTITTPFYVDVWSSDGSGFGYEEIPSMAASSSQTLVINLDSDYPLDGTLTVRAMVDAIDEVDELREDNNLSQTTHTGSVIMESVSVYLLAFDNPSYSAGNLTPQLPETMKGIVAASAGEPDKLAVVLADLDQDGDTHIMTVYDGEITYIDGLPGTDGVLDEALVEYSMADGETLGGFLLWANQTFPAIQTNLYVYAHGAPLAPETDISAVIGNSRDARSPVPLPSWVFVHPDMTDMNPVGLLTPHDLGQALAIGAGDTMVYDVVDLVHCFSLSIEEVYEIAPYADTVTGSPNYAYFDAAMPGAAFAAVDGTMNSALAADSILAAYDALLPQDGYPRIMAAVDTFEIEDVKTLWDDVSAELLIAFDNAPIAARNKLAAAYRASAKYDTNYCEPDWALSEPDALTDMYDFALALVDAFGPASGVGMAASMAADQLNFAVTSLYIENGAPGFTDIDNAPVWTFDGLGISIYTDLAGVPNGGAQQLSWHADFYTKTVSAENPHPYQFITGPTTWADVFARFWQGEATTTAGCVRTFPPVRDSGELTINELVNPELGEAVVNNPLLPSVGLQASAEMGNVIVTFVVEQAGSVVYSDTIGTGRIFSGEHWLKAQRPWTPTETGDYTLTIRVDPQNYVDEANETNNVLVFNDAVSAEAGATIQPDTTVQNGQQWVTDLSAPLTVAGSRSGATQLEVTAYQFAPAQNGISAPIERSTSLHTAAGASLALPLSSNVVAGPVQLHVWDVTGAQRTQLPTPLNINYIPANTPIAQNQMSCFPFVADAGDQVQMRLSVPNGDNANLFVWFPNSFAAPDLVGTRVGDDQLRIDSAPLSGEYLLCVRGETAPGTTYTLSVADNGGKLFAHPTSAENSPTATTPTTRPLFEEPVPNSNTTPTAVVFTHSNARATAWLPMLVLLLAFTTLTLSNRYPKS